MKRGLNALQGCSVMSMYKLHSLRVVFTCFRTRSKTELLEQLLYVEEGEKNVMPISAALNCSITASSGKDSCKSQSSCHAHLVRSSASEMLVWRHG